MSIQSTDLLMNLESHTWRTRGRGIHTPVLEYDTRSVCVCARTCVPVAISLAWRGFAPPNHYFILHIPYTQIIFLPHLHSLPYTIIGSFRKSEDISLIGGLRKGWWCHRGSIMAVMSSPYLVYDFIQLSSLDHS